MKFLFSILWLALGLNYLFASPATSMAELAAVVCFGVATVLLNASDGER